MELLISISTNILEDSIFVEKHIKYGINYPLINRLISTLPEPTLFDVFKRYRDRNHVMFMFDGQVIKRIRTVDLFPDKRNVGYDFNKLKDNHVKLIDPYSIKPNQYKAVQEIEDAISFARLHRDVEVEAVHAH